MRSLCVLPLIALMACDSSSGSKKNPATPSLVIPSSTGDNAVPDGDGGSVTPNDEAEESKPEENQVPDSNKIRFGLTTNRIDFVKRFGDELKMKADAFQTSANQLKEGSLTYCSNPSPETLALARERWKAAMSLWQYFEVFQVGPLKDNAQILKFNIYSWPDQANYCGIDEETIKSGMSANYVLTSRTNRKGLKAIEYILFDADMKGRCADGSAVSKEWATLDSAARQTARCSYLTALTNDVFGQSTTLAMKWGGTDGNYFTPMLQDATKVNQIIQSLYEASYYIDLDVKNQKLAGPAGIDTRYCNTAPEPCLNNAEFPLSDFSGQAARINIAAFADLIFGPLQSERLGGLSALVRGEGGVAVADKTEVVAANLLRTSQADSESSLGQLVLKFAGENCDVTSVSWICQTRNSIRQIFTDLKGEYAAVLKVKAPAAAAGDND